MRLTRKKNKKKKGGASSFTLLQCNIGQHRATSGVNYDFILFLGSQFFGWLGEPSHRHASEHPAGTGWVRNEQPAKKKKNGFLETEACAYFLLSGGPGVGWDARSLIESMAPVLSPQPTHGLLLPPSSADRFDPYDSKCVKSSSGCRMRHSRAMQFVCFGLNRPLYQHKSPSAQA